MAETFTDSKGNVFPLNQFGRPQGYWDGNKFVFPQFGTTPAVSQPVVDPVVPVSPTPYRLPSSVSQAEQNVDGGYYNPFKNQADSVSQGKKANLVSGGKASSNLSLNPRTGALLGSGLGRLVAGPLGSMAGGAIGGYAGGRGARGIGGDIAGTLLGTALFGPVGGLLGIVGGRMGDEADVRAGLKAKGLTPSDMEKVLNIGPSGQRGFFGNLGYGFGLGDSLQDQMSNYYGINQAGIDPFGLFDDIGDIDAGMPDSKDFGALLDDQFHLDTFNAIADAFSGNGQSDGSSASVESGVDFGVF